MRKFSVSVNKLKFGDRLVPTFYYYTQIIKQENQKKGISYIKLGQYSTISDGEHSAIPRNNKNGIRYLYGRNIKEGVVNFDPISDDSYINPSDYESFTRCHIKQNDVLIAIYGTIGKSAIYRKEYIGQAGIPRHISNITIKKGSPITPEYLSAFFRSKLGKWQLFSVTTGNIQQLLSLKNLREFEIPVAAKGVIDKVTNNEREALEYEILAQGKIKEAQQILYGSLNFDVTSIKRDFSFHLNFSELNTNNIWSASLYDKLYVKMADALIEFNGIKTLRELVNFSKGDEVGSENYNDFIDRTDNDKPFIRTSDIVNHEVDLYPDYYISAEATNDVKQKLKEGDVIFTKDGKIGCVGMITSVDDVIISSGIEYLRLTKEALKMGFTQEYLFTALSIPEIGLYAATRRTVIASTIPHLREERLKDIEIPIISQENIDKITILIKEAFKLKSKRKEIIKMTDQLINCYLS